MSFQITLPLQPLPDLPKGCVPRNLSQVEFYVSRNFPKFDWIQFFHLTRREITKLCFEMYNNKIVTSASTRFSRRGRVLRLFPTGCEIRFRDFFLSSHRPAKIYVKSNLLKSSSYCICFWRSVYVTCMKCFQQLAEFWSHYGSDLNWQLPKKKKRH
jgi:hypothetical protein